MIYVFCVPIRLTAFTSSKTYLCKALAILSKAIELFILLVVASISG